jgi:hypothetical protein
MIVVTLFHALSTVRPKKAGTLCKVIIAFFILISAQAGSAAVTVGAPSAAERMQEPGPEAAELQQRSGDWDVVATFRATPDAEAMVTTGLIARRKMVGLYLQEYMTPALGATSPDFTRIAYLTYSRLEGRWQYVSMDTRFPVGIMPAYSFGKQKNDKTLTLIFEPIAFVGMGAAIEGRMVRSNLVVTRTSLDHEIIQQYFITSDGSEREWLAAQYEYSRKP